MVRGKDPFWEYADDKGASRFLCKFCQNVWSGGITRLKYHLSREEMHDISPCTQVPGEIQALAMIAINEMGSKTPKKRSKSMGLTGSSASVNISTTLNWESQATLPNMIYKKDKDAVDKAVAKAFILNNIAFNVINSPSFVEMIKACSNFGVGYSPPSYSTLRTKLVQDTRKDVDSYVCSVKGSWEFSGCTLMADIWTDMKNRSIVNVIAACPKGSVFVKSFECSEHRKTGAYLEQLISSVIEEIGPQNVVQFITDNASNFEVAGVLIEVKFPHIYKSRCSAHGVDLLLKDIDKEVDWVAKVFRDAKMIVDYLYNHVVVLNLMRRHTGGKELKRYCKTRFATNFLMLQSLIQVEDGLRLMMASNEWRGMNYSKTPMGEKIVQVIQDNTFWNEGRDVIALLELIVRVLRLTDSEGSTLGYLYEAMERARDAIKACNNGNQSKYSKVWELFDSRRQGNIVAEIHAVAAFLNPSLMYFGKVKFDNPEIKRGFNQVTQKLIEIDEKNQFISELLVYSGRDPKIFDDVALSMITQSHPRIWWEMCGGEIPVVQKLAIRILSQPCSSSACERNWSAFEAAQTKKRNKLTPTMLDDLVYIRMNSKMMAVAHENEQQDRKPIRLDELGDFPEGVGDTSEEMHNEQEDNTNIGGDPWLDFVDLA